MRQCCFRRKGDLHKCIPIYAVGAVFLIVGVPLMVAGIIGGFDYSDFIGYVGGICIFFGVLFWFLWHMVTIPNAPDTAGKDFCSEEGDELPHGISAIPDDSAAAYANLGYERERILPGNDDVIVDADSLSYDVIDPNSNNSSNRAAYVNRAFSTTEENNISAISNAVIGRDNVT